MQVNFLSASYILSICAVVISLITALVLWNTLKHDVGLRKAELAVKMAELEYERLKLKAVPGNFDVFAPQQLLDIYLRAVEELYEGTFDAARFRKWSKARVNEFRKIDDAI